MEIIYNTARLRRPERLLLRGEGEFIGKKVPVVHLAQACGRVATRLTSTLEYMQGQEVVEQLLRSPEATQEQVSVPVSRTNADRIRQKLDMLADVAGPAVVHMLFETMGLPQQVVAHPKGLE